MAVSSKYITPTELRDIADLCESLFNLYGDINASTVNIGLFVEPNSDGITHPVYDFNGDVLGHIGFTDDGMGLYFDTDPGSV